MPRAGKDLVFHPGIILQAIANNKWLIVDEINRADIDKAFGPLLTLLSGQDVTLPYTDAAEKNISIRSAGGLESYYSQEEATYYMGDNWRILATMNTFDKNSLFTLSYAFMRRFGFVHINSPAEPQLHRIIGGREQDHGITSSDAARVKLLLTLCPRELGPAILIDILNYLQERNSPQALFEAVVAYVLPQFEGLSVENIVDFANKSSQLFVDETAIAQLNHYLAEMFDINADTFEN